MTRTLCRSLVLLAVAAVPLRAQDTSRVLDQGVRVGITYSPGMRPGLVVVPSAGLDSLRTIVQRDLDFSDQFELVILPATVRQATDGPSSASSSTPAPLNYSLYRSLGANYAVECYPAGESGRVAVRVHDVGGATIRREGTFTIPEVWEPGFRQAVHRLSDEVVRWITGVPGFAATQIAFVADKRIWRVDTDGAGLSALTNPGEEPLSPTWSPDGRRIAFTMFAAGRGSIVVQTLATGARATVPSTERNLNITPAFSPDGRTLAFAHSSEDGTDIFTANMAERCCVQRLTVGRYADNLSPTYAPDGRRMAFVSTRAGLPQIYAMSADGTDQELLAPFDYGITGSSNAPDWSPDGARVVFHRDVGQTLQIFLLDVASRRVRQLTSTGRNEDPSWAPDGRHITFVSDRSGRGQLWVIDVETGRIRQVSTPGAARLPAWSRRLDGIP